MKNKVVTLVGLILILAGVGSVEAQRGCKSFQAIAQASLPTSTRLLATDKWGGPLYAKFGDEYLQGIISGNDGTKVEHGSIAVARDGRYTVGFDYTPGTPYTCTDTMFVEIPVATFPSPPPVFGTFIANTARVNGGTCRFASASGNLNYGGTFVVWPVAGTPPFNGRFNAELSGRICE